MATQSVLAAALGLLVAITAATAQDYKAFVVCPIVRDTRTVPCYLAEYQGESYFLGTPDDFRDTEAPQLKHKLLVEGTVASGQRVCGGIPLKPVAVSVLKEVDLSCNTLLPAEPGIEAPAAGSAQTASSTDYTVYYAFDSDQITPHDERIITAAAAAAKKASASVIVTGYRSASRLSSGELLSEKSGIGARRARTVATLLHSLGVAKVTVDSKDEAEPGDASRRRATIAVNP